VGGECLLGGLRKAKKIGERPTTEEKKILKGLSGNVDCSLVRHRERSKEEGHTKKTNAVRGKQEDKKTRGSGRRGGRAVSNEARRSRHSEQGLVPYKASSLRDLEKKKRVIGTPPFTLQSKEEK